MKLKSLLFLAAVAVGSQANAQLGPWIADTVTLGPGYANDVYYHMDHGTVKTEANNNWHIGFAAGVINRNGAVIANQVANGVEVYPLNNDVTKFGMDLSSDTTTAKTMPLYNVDHEVGALNMNADPTDFFDYGWGEYDPSSHFVEGTTIFYIKTKQGGKYQFYIEEYKSTPVDSMSWLFHIANIDGTNPITKKVYVKPYLKNIFVYYDINADAFIAREPENNLWDILFTRYMDLQGTTWYPVTGALSNYNVGVAELRHVDADTAQYRSYALDSSINVIGQDWKKPPMGPPTGPGYDLDTVTYFVKSKNNSIYELEFTYASFSSAGKIGLRRRLAAYFTPPAGINTIAAAENRNMAIAPNPAVNNADLFIDVTNGGNAQVLITDITGRTIMYKALSLKDGLNAIRINTSEYAAGTYLVTVTNGSWKLSNKLIVQH